MGNYKDLSNVNPEKPNFYIVAENGIVIKYDEKSVMLNEKVLEEMKAKLEKGYNVIVISNLDDKIFEEVLKIHKEKNLLPTGYNNVNGFDLNLSNPESYVIGGQFFNTKQLGQPTGVLVEIMGITNLEDALKKIDELKKENEELKKKLEIALNTSTQESVEEVELI